MITIYGKENCSFCDQAKKFMIIQDIEFVYKDIFRDLTETERTLLLEITQARTVPIIFIGDDTGEYIGGFNELKKWYDKNE